MGLKESGLRGSLRNVSVGIDAIPDGSLYQEGTENEPWIEGRNEGGVLSKEEDHLYLLAEEPDDTLRVSWTTENEIDLSEYNQISVEVDVLQLDGLGYITATENPDGVDDSDDSQPIEFESTTNGREEFTGDISDINEPRHIGIYGFDNNSISARPVEIETYIVDLIE